MKIEKRVKWFECPNLPKSDWSFAIKRVPELCEEFTGTTIDITKHWYGTYTLVLRDDNNKVVEKYIGDLTFINII